MAIAFDNSGNSGMLINQSSFSTNFTCNGDILIVTVSCLTTSSDHTASYGGIPLTMLVENTNATVNSHIMYLVNPPQGTNLINVTSTTLIHAWTANWESYSGVDQYHPFEGTNTNQGSGGGTGSVNVLKAQNNDWVILTIATEDSSVVPGAGQTDRQNIADSHGTGAESDIGPEGIGTTTVSYTGIAASKLWSLSATALQPTGVTIPIVVSDSTTITENLSETGIIRLAVNDTTTTSENLGEVEKDLVNVNDSSTVTDIPLYDPDLVYVNETVGSVINHHLDITESVTTNDSLTQEPIPNPVAIENVTTSQLVLVAFGGDVDVISELTVTESTTMGSVPNPTAFDDVAVTESFPITIPRLFIAPSDNVATTESSTSNQVYDVHAFELPLVTDFPGFYPDSTTVTEFVSAVPLNPFSQFIGENVAVNEHFTLREETRPFANPNQQLVIKIHTKNF